MLSSTYINYIKKPRIGSMDLWNGTPLEGASYTEGNDIPICYTCTGTIPIELIAYDDAKMLHNKLVKKNPMGSGICPRTCICEHKGGACFPPNAMEIISIYLWKSAEEDGNGKFIIMV